MYMILITVAPALMEDDGDNLVGVVESTMNVDRMDADISLHAIKEQASARARQDIRPHLCREPVESSAIQEKQQCILCTERALYMCYECGSNAYYCQKCFNKAHTEVNIFMLVIFSFW